MPLDASSDASSDSFGPEPRTTASYRLSKEERQLVASLAVAEPEIEASSSARRIGDANDEEASGLKKSREPIFERPGVREVSTATNVQSTVNSTLNSCGTLAKLGLAKRTTTDPARRHIRVALALSGKIGISHGKTRPTATESDLIFNLSSLCLQRNILHPKPGQIVTVFVHSWDVPWRDRIAQACE